MTHLTFLQMCKFNEFGHETKLVVKQVIRQHCLTLRQHVALL